MKWLLLSIVDFKSKMSYSNRANVFKSKISNMNHTEILIILNSSVMINKEGAMGKCQDIWFIDGKRSIYSTSPSLSLIPSLSCNSFFSCSLFCLQIFLIICSAELYPWSGASGCGIPSAIHRVYNFFKV